jgi:hypothetical protein
LDAANVKMLRTVEQEIITGKTVIIASASIALPTHNVVVNYALHYAFRAWNIRICNYGFLISSPRNCDSKKSSKIKRELELSYNGSGVTNGQGEHLCENTWYKFP